MSTELTYDDVARIFAILDMAEGESLDFTFGERRIAVTSWPPQQDKALGGPPARESNRSASASSRPDAETAHSPPDCLAVEVRAQEVGYYRAVADLGTRLDEGDLLGEITGLHGKAGDVLAPKVGRLAELCIGDGAFVEYGEVVAVIEPSEALTSSRGTSQGN